MGHDRWVPPAVLEPTVACPGCGSVLVTMPGGAPAHPGASASCTRLFETTLRGVREEASADLSAARVVALADATYDAQHPVAGDPGRTAGALARLARALDAEAVAPAAATRLAAPAAWRTTIADVAADLDVIELRVLVDRWARTVVEDWSGVPLSGV